MTIEPTADEIERIAEAIYAVRENSAPHTYGYLRPDLAKPYWEAARAAILAMDRRAEIDVMRAAIAWANNSLFGSHSFFLSTNGGEPDEHHLDRAIEELKTLVRRASLPAEQVKTVPEGQTPLNKDLGHRLLDVFNEGVAARDSGAFSPYHGHSLEHCLSAAGWVQRDLRIALDAAKLRIAELEKVIEENGVHMAELMPKYEVLRASPPAPAVAIEPNSEKEWALELRACGGANDQMLPKYARRLIADLWAEVVAREPAAAAPVQEPGQ